MVGLLLSQKKVLKKLTKNGIVTFTRTPFAEAVNKGVIPHQMVDGFKDKLFDYDDCVKAIKKAGIGNPPKSIEQLPDIKEGQSKDDYELEVKALGLEPTLTDANIYKTLYVGKLEKLKYEREVGLLILRSEVEDKAFTTARHIRNKILTIPERLSNELASMSAAHAIKELLFKEFEILLDGFSEESFYENN
jgi:hypothetical protein